MKHTFAISAVIFAILCSAPGSYASDKWGEGDIIGTVETVLTDGLLLKNVYLKLPDAPPKPEGPYYEYGTSKYAKIGETIFIYKDTVGFTVNDPVAGSVRYQDMHSPGKMVKGRNSNDVRAFAVFGILAKLDSIKDLKGPVSAGGGGAKTFTLYNPITKERETTSDSEAASKFVAKGWMLESTSHTTNAMGRGEKTFTLYNPVTKERETTSDPETASKFVAKGWMLESATHTPKAPK